MVLVLFNCQVQLSFYYAGTIAVGLMKNHFTEVAVKMCSYKKVLWKYAANLQEVTHAEVWYQ